MNSPKSPSGDFGVYDFSEQIVKFAKPQSEFMTRLHLLIINVLLFCCCADDKPQQLITTSLNFYGCQSLQSGSGCAVQYEVLPNQYLKIIRQGEKLNCSVDSIKINLSHKSNSIQIEEIQCLDKAAFCECHMSYEYILGPLVLSNYEITILSPTGSSYKFMVKSDDRFLNKTCE
jgi:hypothetical protein